jgi:hypothetical protein
VGKLVRSVEEEECGIKRSESGVGSVLYIKYADVISRR